MELFLIAFVVLLLVAAPWTVDSRDYADWQPSEGGFRRSPRDG